MCESAGGVVRVEILLPMMYDVIIHSIKYKEGSSSLTKLCLYFIRYYYSAHKEWRADQVE